MTRAHVTSAHTSPTAGASHCANHTPMKSPGLRALQELLRACCCRGVALLLQLVRRRFDPAPSPGEESLLRRPSRVRRRDEALRRVLRSPRGCPSKAGRVFRRRREVSTEGRSEIPFPRFTPIPSSLDPRLHRSRDRKYECHWSSKRRGIATRYAPTTGTPAMPRQGFSPANDFLREYVVSNAGVGRGIWALQLPFSQC